MAACHRTLKRKSVTEKRKWHNKLFVTCSNNSEENVKAVASKASDIGE